MTSDAPRAEGEGRDAAIDRAYEEVYALCKGKRWTMHVPVEETDSDMVITAGLEAAERAVGRAYEAGRAAGLADERARYEALRKAVRRYFASTRNAGSRENIEAYLSLEALTETEPEP